MTDPISTPTRRQVLLTSGTVAAAVAVTAACGTSDGGSGSGEGSTATPSAAGATVKAADVPVGGGVIVQDARIVVTQPQEGTYKAFTAVCTHQGCIVSSVQDGSINCACHGSAFSAVDGSVVQGPARAPLAELTATVSGDSITVS
ncbi:MAG: Rieske (2Fe-2S) protein [Candidatus Nanopelagicales bacterium]